MTATNINSNVCLFIIFTFLVGPALWFETRQLAQRYCVRISLFCSAGTNTTLLKKLRRKGREALRPVKRARNPNRALTPLAEIETGDLLEIEPPAGACQGRA